MSDRSRQEDIAFRLLNIAALIATISCILTVLAPQPASLLTTAQEISLIIIAVVTVSLAVALRITRYAYIRQISAVFVAALTAHLVFSSWHSLYASPEPGTAMTFGYWIQVLLVVVATLFSANVARMIGAGVLLTLVAVYGPYLIGREHIGGDVVSEGLIRLLVSGVILITLLYVLAVFREKYSEEQTRADLAEETSSRMAEAARRERQASEAKSAFMRTVSHELLTPLNAIIGFSEMMRDQAFGPLGNERYREYAIHINESGAGLRALITQVLNYSRLMSEGADLTLETTDISPLIAKVVDGLAETATAKRLEIQTDLATGVRARTHGECIEHILAQVIGNAVTFTPAGGTVAITLTNDKTCVITVQDNGPGIDSERIETILQPFGRGQESMVSGENAGMGLGLPISKSLLELVNGRMSIESEVGVGTTVTITLPPSRNGDRPRRTDPAPADPPQSPDTPLQRRALPA